MKAEEIRIRQEEIHAITTNDPTVLVGHGVCYWMTEIAAQLAEANENPKWIDVSSRGYSIRIDASGVRAVFPNVGFGGTFCDVIFKDGGKYIIDGTLEGVCTKLGITVEGA